MVRPFLSGDGMTEQKSLSLEQVRTRIDAVDAEILRLIDERSALADQVRAAKQAAGDGDKFALRPARESQVIRRLLAMPRIAATPAIVVRIWRELMGDNLNRQGAFHLGVWGGRGGAARITELARQRFGQSVYMQTLEKPEQILATAKTHGGVGVGLLTHDSAWWARLLVEPKLHVFAVLPCLAAWGPPEALAVAEVEMEPSGPDDQTLWVTDSPKKSWEIETELSINGVAAQMIAEASGLKLFTLAGFYQKNDERLARAPGRLSGVIGAAPAPFDL